MRLATKKEIFKIIRTVFALAFGVLMITPLLFMISTSFKTEGQILGNTIFSGYRIRLFWKIMYGYLQICRLSVSL